MDLKKDYIIAEKALLPEGLAVDDRTGIIYVSSTYKRKIVQIEPNGKVSDFIPSQTDSIWSIVGMEVDEDSNILWANMAHALEVMPLINPDISKDWMTGIIAFNVKTKKMIGKYILNEEPSFLNDLTTLPDGSVYITESINNKIYRVNKSTHQLEVFLEPKGFTFLNGITFSKTRNALFVAATEGILKIDLNAAKYCLLSAPNIDATAIDGLTLYNNMLIGHQSSKVTKFLLDEKGESIIKAEVLNSEKEFDSSTTGEISNGYYYFIVNSQIRSGIEREKKKIKPLDSLENIIIRKIKL